MQYIGYIVALIYFVIGLCVANALTKRMDVSDNEEGMTIWIALFWPIVVFALVTMFIVFTCKKLVDTISKLFN